MDETRARVLAAIAAQVPPERIAEAHLFAPIRQGGVESGVAVVALEHEPAAVDFAGGASSDAAAAPDAVTADAASQDAASQDADSQDADSPDSAPSELAADVREDETGGAPADTPERYTVCTARYKHTLKGPDRGKWEVTVTEEADAPLVTVDAVVRGVQRRSGDVDEIVRLSGDELRAALPAPAEQRA
jgi:hypothetical protein